MGVRPEYTNYHDYLKWRLDRRCKVIRDKADRVIDRYIQTTDAEQNSIEDDRIWLDKFAVGQGLDVCCGDFLIGTEDQAEGVDGDTHRRGRVGTDYFYQGDDLSFSMSSSLDFIVTNYFDGLESAIKTLNEWHRALRPGGVLALICQDADSYGEHSERGALSNCRRTSTYSKTTLKHYLYRCDFTKVKIESTAHGTIRASAIKE